LRSKCAVKRDGEAVLIRAGAVPKICMDKREKRSREEVSSPPISGDETNRNGLSHPQLILLGLKRTAKKHERRGAGP